MNDKSIILQNMQKYLKDKTCFAYRVCILLKEGEFDEALSSMQLIQLLNEGVGKRVNARSLTSFMRPLLADGIIDIVKIGTGKRKHIYWFPNWLNKRDVKHAFSDGVEPEKVLFFTGKESWSDLNIVFPKIIGMLKGDLDIVDPYYGNGTFHVLRYFGKQRKIRFITCTLANEEKDKLSEFEGNLKRFKNDHKNITIKKYDKFYELHDRYILADNALVIVGYGIKDIAKKESFIVFLPSKMVGQTMGNLKKSFNERWKTSENL